MLVLATLISAFGSSFQYGYNVAAINSPSEVDLCGERDLAPTTQGGGFGAVQALGVGVGGTGWDCTQVEGTQWVLEERDTTQAPGDWRTQDRGRSQGPGLARPPGRWP